MFAISLTTQLTVVGRIALAAALGFVVGLERETRGKSAGERTIALVAAASAAFGALAVVSFPVTGGQLIAGVAVGIGFLGGGVIWRSGMGPARGLTTAAAAWTVAATCVLAGVGYYLAALLSTAITVLILEVEYLPVVGRFVHRMPSDEETMDRGPGTEPDA